MGREDTAHESEVLARVVRKLLDGGYRLEDERAEESASASPSADAENGDD